MPKIIIALSQKGRILTIVNVTRKDKKMQDYIKNLSVNGYLGSFRVIA